LVNYLQPSLEETFQRKKSQAGSHDPACLVRFSFNKGLKRRHGLLGFRPHGIVGTDPCIANIAGLIDDIPGRHGQGPGIITIELRHIDAEFQIECTQVIRQPVPDPVALGNRVARITQNVNLQLLFGFY